MPAHYGKKPTDKKKPKMMGGGMAVKKKKPAMMGGGMAYKKPKKK
jgi:hypothetical protein